MSSLEERRAERRRRRQMEEAMGGEGSTKSPDEIQADVQERLARRRREREERMASLSSSVATVNGDDDREKRRKERQERIRDSAPADDYSSRRDRRRGTDDDTSTEDSHSYRSRRRRNWDDEEAAPIVNDTPSVPDTSEADSAEERRRRQREEEEEEARRQQEREEAEERRREQRRREEEEDRRRAEEDARRREEEEERRREEERLRQEVEEAAEDEARAAFETLEQGESSQEEDTVTSNQLFIVEDDFIAHSSQDAVDKLERVRQWNESSGHKAGPTDADPDIVVLDRSVSDQSPGYREINNNKIRDKLNKFEHLKDVEPSKTSKSAMFIPEKKDGLKSRLNKFEQEIKQQDAASPSTRKTEPVVYTPPSQKLSVKLKHFEAAAKLQSSSRPACQRATQVKDRDTNKKKVLDRWQSADKPSQEAVVTRTKAKPERTEVHTKRLSGNTEYIASKFLEKASKSVEESPVASPRQHATPVSPTSHRQNTSSERSLSPLSSVSPLSSGSSQGHTQAQVAERWPIKDDPPLVRQTVTVNLTSYKRQSSNEAMQDRQLGIDATQNSRPSNDTTQDRRSSNDLTQRRTSNDTAPRRSSNDSEPRRSSNDTEPRRSSKDTEPRRSSNDTEPRRSINDRTQRRSSNDTEPRRSSNDRTQRRSSIDANVNHSRGSSQDSSEVSRHQSQLSQEEEEEQERLEAERMAAEEQSKKRGKRKGLGGLTPEKKKLLKDGMVDYDSEEEEDKIRWIQERVPPLPNDIDYLSSAELRKLCKQLHEKLAQMHSDLYDWEFKVGKQEQEVSVLTMKINDSKGKFVKPVLRKVNKTEQKFAKLAKKTEVKEDFRETLKSAHDEEQEAE